MTEPTNTDVLEAVTQELSRFTRDVVAEMHRLRDELAAERRRTDQLESTVTSLTASLRKFDTQAANIVDHITKLSADVDRRLDDIESQPDDRSTSVSAVAAPEPGAEPAAEELATEEAAVSTVDDEEIHFAPLILALDPVEPEPPHDSSLEDLDDLDDLVARVIGAIDAPTDQVNDHDRVESGSAR